MTWVMVDVEADGPIPGDYSMVEIGAVVVKEGLDKTFYGQLRPISDKWDPSALRVTRWTREQTMEFFPAARTMIRFHAWLSHIKNPRFVSDNNGFDWMFTCWYLHHFVGTNLFGHSSTNLGSLYKGMVKNLGKSFKHLRRTAHTHNPMDDAKGNAEAMLEILKEFK